MAATPEIEDVVEQARDALMRMYRDGWVGEVAIVVGGNQYQVEARPRWRYVPVKRHDSKSSVIETVEQI